MLASGEVDWASLATLVDYHVSAGTSAIVAVGTTGESVTLSEQEHIAVVEKTVALAAGRIPVIAGCGSNNTTHAVDLAKRFAETGVVAGLSVTPYYNKPTQEGLYRHYCAIAEASGLPQILYNVPGRTGCDLKPETVARLAKVPGIIGLKEATGDLSRTRCCASCAAHNSRFIVAMMPVDVISCCKAGTESFRSPPILQRPRWPTCVVLRWPVMPDERTTSTID